MKISFVIPTLNEEKALKDNLNQFLWLKSNGCEIIVVDANSNDKSLEIAKLFADKIEKGPRKISKQKNIGAKLAKGDFIFFLYADIILPRNFNLLLDYLRTNPNIIGGGFRRRWKSKGKKAYFDLFDKYSDWRIWLFRTFPGDHLIFIKKKIFQDIGGFPDLYLMHDIEFCRKVNKKYKTKKLICIKNPVFKSPRRLIKRGYFRTYYHWLLITIIYYLLGEFKNFLFYVFHNYLRTAVR
ncbi:MAG: glycosyltransferase [Candidatus Helarchaeota archaeon]